MVCKNYNYFHFNVNAENLPKTTAHLYIGSQNGSAILR